MKTFLKLMIPLVLWLFILYVIGLSIDTRWGGQWGFWIPLALFSLSLQYLIKGLKELSEEKIQVDIPLTQEEIDDELNEGRD